MSALQTQTWIEPFSQREIEILGLISAGLSNHEISQKLLLSPETVKWYNKQIFGKLGARSRIQAVRMASELGLLDSQRAATAEEESRRSSNLPAQLTSFVGRVKEIAEIKYLLKSSRLVVLTGPGGCGKSRLALQVATDLVDSYRDGVWLVELASISEPALVANAIVQTLQINASGDTSLTNILKRFLAHKHLLLLLDNFEHLPEASPLVGELLAAAPQLSVLATSRERLHIYGEQEYPVQPLSLPDLKRGKTKEQLLSYESVNLFVQRARAVQPGFTADEDQIFPIARICVRLDGLPLAIELAASQVKIFPPVTLVQRLEDGLDALPSGPRDVPARQRTLHATLDWSYNLLQEDEKILFARLSVFSGGGTLDGIIHICNHGLPRNIIEILSALVEKNLVYSRQGSDGELCFTMLETIHEYASECLSAFGEAESIRILHADYFAHLAEVANAEIYTAKEGYWFAHLREELDNLRSILTWSLNGNECEYGLQLAAALHTYWAYDGLGAEGNRWTDMALTRSTNAAPALRAGVLRSAGHIASYINDLRRGKELLHQALELYQQVRDERNIAWSMVYLGAYYQENLHEYAQGIALCTQALAQFRKLEYKPGMAYTFNVLGELARLQDDYEAARHYYEESLSVVKETGERQREAILLNNLSLVAYYQQDYRLAMQLSQKSIILAGELKSEFIQASLLATLAGPIAALGQPERAARLQGASYARYEALDLNYQPQDQRELDLFTAAARSQLGEIAFQEAWQAGQAMTLQEAVSLALADADLGK